MKRQLSLLDLPAVAVAPTVWDALDHEWRSRIVSMLARLIASAAVRGRPELVGTNHEGQNHD